MHGLELIFADYRSHLGQTQLFEKGRFSLHFLSFHISAHHLPLKTYNLEPSKSLFCSSLLYISHFSSQFRAHLSIHFSAVDLDISSSIMHHHRSTYFSRPASHERICEEVIAMTQRVFSSHEDAASVQDITNTHRKAPAPLERDMTRETFKGPREIFDRSFATNRTLLFEPMKSSKEWY